MSRTRLGTVLHLRSSGDFLGAERVIIELARRSSSLGWDPIILVLCDEPSPALLTAAAEHGLRAEAIRCRGRLDLRAVAAIRELAARERVDLVHSHGYKEDFYGLIARVRRPMIATNHLWKDTTARLKLYRYADSICLRFFDHIVAVSEPIHDDMRRLGIAKEKLSIIPNGIDTDRFRRPAAPDQARKLRADLGLRPDSLVACTIGSLSLEKGHVNALQALRSLVEDHPRLQLLIVGEGAQGDALRREAASLDLGGRVRFAGRRSDIPAILNCIDIFLLPSLQEGFPMALLEAMAAGRPVVATDVGDVRKAVSAGRTGLLVPPGNPSAMSGALAKLVSSPELREELGERARATVTERFSADLMTKRYCELYERVADGERSLTRAQRVRVAQ